MNERNDSNNSSEAIETDPYEPVMDEAMRTLFVDEEYGRQVAHRVFERSRAHLHSQDRDGEPIAFESTVPPSALPPVGRSPWLVYAGIAAAVALAVFLASRYSFQSNRTYRVVESQTPPALTTTEFAQVDAEFDEVFAIVADGLYSDIEIERTDATAPYGWDSYDGALTVEMELAVLRLWDNLESF